MKTALIKTSSSDKTRFEVHSTPSRGPVQKWYMKANHPVEAQRWVNAINGAIEWFKREGGMGTDGDGNSLAPASAGGRRSLDDSSATGSKASLMMSAVSVSASVSEFQPFTNGEGNTNS